MQYSTFLLEGVFAVLQASIGFVCWIIVGEMWHPRMCYSLLLDTVDGTEDRSVPYGGSSETFARRMLA
ncbi:hypothetical protein A8A04_08990 [Escherichia coli]|nr:hypothetical protein A8A04_08990 [Escherichia coli]